MKGVGQQWVGIRELDVEAGLPVVHIVKGGNSADDGTVLVGQVNLRVHHIWVAWRIPSSSGDMPTHKVVAIPAVEGEGVKRYEQVSYSEGVGCVVDEVGRNWYLGQDRWVSDGVAGPYCNLITVEDLVQSVPNQSQISDEGHYLNIGSAGENEGKRGLSYPLVDWLWRIHS